MRKIIYTILLLLIGLPAIAQPCNCHMEVSSVTMSDNTDEVAVYDPRKGEKMVVTFRKSIIEICVNYERIMYYDLPGEPWDGEIMNWYVDSPYLVEQWSVVGWNDLGDPVSISVIKTGGEWTGEYKEPTWTMTVANMKSVSFISFKLEPYE